MCACSDGRRRPLSFLAATAFRLSHMREAFFSSFQSSRRPPVIFALEFWISEMAHKRHLAVSQKFQSRLHFLFSKSTGASTRSQFFSFGASWLDGKDPSVSLGVRGFTEKSIRGSLPSVYPRVHAAVHNARVPSFFISLVVFRWCVWGCVWCVFNPRCHREKRI